MNQHLSGNEELVFDGRTIRLEDGRRVSLDWLIWNGRQQQSRAIGRLCGELVRAVWQAVESLFGPPLGWQRRQLPRLTPRQRYVRALGQACAGERFWFDPTIITDSEGYRTDAALGHKTTSTENRMPIEAHSIQGSRSAAA